MKYPERVLVYVQVTFPKPGKPGWLIPEHIEVGWKVISGEEVGPPDRFTPGQHPLGYLFANLDSTVMLPGEAGFYSRVSDVKVRSLPHRNVVVRDAEYRYYAK